MPEEHKTINIKKKKSNRPIYYGVATGTGELLSIDNVERGLACGCICPSCETRLEARKGEKMKHHFAHENNQECLYGAEISVYRAFYELLDKSKRFFLPDAVLTFNSHKKDEIVKRGNMISLTKIEFHNDTMNYPPELLCYSGENCFQIVLDIESYYNAADYRSLKEYGKKRDIAIVSVEMDDIDRLSSFGELQVYIDAPDRKKWIFNRVVEEWDRKYREIAVEPASFENGHVCLAQKNRHKNVYSARIEDCISCRYCYDHMRNKCCLAPSFIDHVEDFRKPIEERQREFAEINKLKTIKKISEYECPKCGAPMRRRVGPNGVFAGCSKYPQCKGSRQVEQTTEQVIIPHMQPHWRRYKIDVWAKPSDRPAEI